MLATEAPAAAGRARRGWLRRVGVLGSGWVALVLLSTVGFAVLRDRDHTLRLTPSQQVVIDRLESVLLHDTVVPQYQRVVDGYDGRGYVAGIGDFSTAHGEAFEIVQAYAAQLPGNPLSRGYLNALAELSRGGSADVRSLAGFPEAWREASADPLFRHLQDDALLARYAEPALNLAHTLGLRTPLGYAVLFDSILQHGNAADPDGLPALLQRTRERAGGGPDAVGERVWLTTFLDTRRRVLADPVGVPHQQVWPYSVGRIDALSALLTAGRDNLDPPLVVAPYGTRHLIDLNPLPEPLVSVPDDPSSAPAGGWPNPSAGQSWSSAPNRPPGTPPVPRRTGAVLGIGGLCLDVNNARSTPGTHVKVWDCNGTVAQVWTTEADGTLRALGQCAQLQSNSTAAGTPIEIDPCDGRSTQQWRFRGGQLISPGTGWCVSVEANSDQAGAAVVLQRCAGLAGQRWSLPGGS